MVARPWLLFKACPKNLIRKRSLKSSRRSLVGFDLILFQKTISLTRPRLACNGTIVNDTEMGEVIQLQGDQRKDVQEFLVDKKEGLELDAKTIKVTSPTCKSQLESS